MDNSAYLKYIRERIDELRIKKDISEYQLSLELGHSQGYIQSLTSGRNLPSMNAFLDICSYFDISPAEFFDPEMKNPSLINSIISDIKKLTYNDLLLLSTVLKRILELYPEEQ